MVARVGDAVPGAERQADVVAWSNADLFDELGELTAKLVDAVSLPGVVGVTVPALVDGDDSELVMQGAGYVVSLGCRF